VNFYDFEVFRHDWLVVIINPVTQTEKVIVNDVKKLQRYYEKHKNDIWVGYNSRHYDQYILKALLCGFDAWDMNEHLFTHNLPGWAFSNLLKKIPLINYDVMPLNSSLKQLEGFQGHNIHESGVDFRIDRKLTAAEIAETITYCRNDVLETINVFCELKDDFNAQMDLINMFNMPLNCMSKTKAQISAEVLECERKDFNDEWDLFVLPCIQLEKYKAAADWFLNPENHDMNKGFEIMVAGIIHALGWGGIHGALEKYHYECKDGYMLLHVDVQSYYPSLMIEWELLTRASKNPGRYRYVKEYRLQLKAEGKKKEQAPLKIVLNAAYGITNDKNSTAYDPRNSHLITVNGQLMLLDLIEHLEAIPSFELVQSNTDGLIIKIHERDFDMCDDICYEWETRTKMNLEFDYIERIAQKDVNNYVFVQYPDDKGKVKIERKGAYVKELSAIDNDLPIINKAIVECILHGTPAEETINKCNELIQFQKICKLTSKFDFVEHNGKEYTNKCYRIFASKNENDGSVQKVKYIMPTYDRAYYKFANTSVHSFIENGDITGAKVPAKLDKQWYINLAKERLRQYGIKD
jgi:DNA polymerase